MLIKLRRTVARLYHNVLTIWYMQYRRYYKFKQRRALEQEFNYWRSQKAKVLKAGEKGYRLKIQELGLEPEYQARLQDRQQREPEIVIGDIDRNGLLLSYWGPIGSMPTVGSDQYLERRRFRVELVSRDGYVGVRKSYAGRKAHFVNELKVLHRLAAVGCHVPVIMAVDFENLTLTTSYIAGRVLKEELAAHGAQLYASGPGKHTARHPVERARVRAERAAEGKRVLAGVIGEDCIEKLYQELCKIHAAGVMDIDIQYGNVIIEATTKQPYWIDFEHATTYSKLAPRASQVLCRRDVDRFNLFFGTDKPVQAVDSRLNKTGLEARPSKAQAEGAAGASSIEVTPKGLGELIGGKAGQQTVAAGGTAPDVAGE